MFPCTKCGACCRMTGLLPDGALESVGLQRGPQGWCSHLKGDECEIYETRPDVCRVDKTMEQRHGVANAQTAQLTALFCNALILAQGHGTLITPESLKHAYGV